ncbi:MAG: LysM domain-containing protein [Desulfatiglandales bacterium]|nr:LysM domain-containing protein [Desulfatiglandales bacterium]
MEPRVEQRKVDEVKLVATKEKALQKPAPVEKKVLKRPETDTKGKGPPALNKAGYYVVQKGDSFPKIAARKDVYGDPLNWPILYRLNRDKFDKRATGVYFPKKISPGE